MLLLSRKAGDTVLIGEPPHQIKVVVVEIRGDRIRLGIEAPDDVKIIRREILWKYPELRDPPAA